jgi:hypothetical protein
MNPNLKDVEINIVLENLPDNGNPGTLKAYVRPDIQKWDYWRDR